MSDRTVGSSEVNAMMTRERNLTDETLLMMQPENNWEEKIIPAPLILATLGQLMAISSITDIKLQDPKKRDENVRSCNSLHLKLAQICEEGYKAFHKAHNAMNEIRLLTKEVPRYMKDAVSILFNGTDPDVENALPVSLKSIEDIAVACKESSECVVTKFGSVKDLISDLQEACLLTQSVSDSSMKQLELEMAQQEIKQNELKKNQERFNELYMKTSEEMDKCFKEYEKATHELPSGGKILAFNIVDTVLNVLATPTRLFTYVNLKLNERSTGKKNPYVFDDYIAFNMGFRLKDVVEALKEFFDDQNALKTIPVQSELFTTLRKNKHGIETILKETTNLNSKLEIQDEIIDAAKVALGCYEDIEKGTGINAEVLLQKIKLLSEKAIAIGKSCSDAVNQDFLDIKGPNAPLNFKWNENISTASKLSQQACFKMKVAQERLSDLEKRYSSAQENMLKNSDEMVKSLSKFKEFDAAKATTKELFEILRTGLDQLSELKERWVQLAHFFDSIVLIIRINVNKNLSYYVTHSKNQIQNRHEISDVMRNILHKTTLEAVTYSYVAHHMAAGYFIASEKHLMPSISSLEKLLTIRTKEDVKTAQEKLSEDCEKASEEIKSLLQKLNQEFQSKVPDRRNMITTEFSNVLKPNTEVTRRGIFPNIKMLRKKKQN